MGIIKFYKTLLICVFLLISMVFFGQAGKSDTVRLTLNSTDSLFLSKNLQLIAEKYNIEVSKAQIIQAKLFTNLTFSLEQNIYNPQEKQWFPISDSGETSVQIQKVLRLAGQRSKQVKLAKLNTEKEEQNYFDLLRTLKFTLHSTLFNIYYLNRSMNIYTRETDALKHIISVFEQQLNNGYVSKAEVLRLKAELFSIENEKYGLFSQLVAAQGDMNVLLHTSGVFYFPAFNKGTLSFRNPDSLHLQVLIDTALANRYDYKMAQMDVSIGEMNLKYQKALGAPAFALMAGWDKNGSYVHNYNYIGFQVDLPWFNINQGNIKSAKFIIESNKAKLQTAADQVRNDVVQAYSLALENQKLVSHFDESFSAELDQTIAEYIKNYEKHNISLLEFLDYYDAYKQNAVQYNTFQFNRMNSLENLNLVVGKDVCRIHENK